MSTSRPFAAASNKLAYAQAFSRTSTRRPTGSPRPARRHRITLRRRHRTIV